MERCNELLNFIAIFPVNFEVEYVLFTFEVIFNDNTPSIVFIKDREYDKHYSLLK